MTLKKSQYVLFFDDRQDEAVAGIASERIPKMGEMRGTKKGSELKSGTYTSLVPPP
jgi:hypothetical protein